MSLIEVVLLAQDANILLVEREMHIIQKMLHMLIVKRSPLLSLELM